MVQGQECLVQGFQEVKPKLQKILDDKNLQWINATRNAIVHNRSASDKDFARQVKRHPTLRLVEEGTPILLDGNVVAALVEATVSRGMELLQFADDSADNRGGSL